MRYTNVINVATDLIAKGKLVAFPTETVYGIGADASNDLACKAIYTLKGRPSNNPLIVHVSSVVDAERVARFNESAECIAENFWPGPITLVLPLNDESLLSKTVTAGLSTVAIRMPSHKIALEFIRSTGVPIAAPSANPSGYISASRAEHVRNHFPDLFILPDDDSMHVGLESTILDLSTNEPTILRHGFITADVISRVLDRDVKYYASSSDIKAPGMLLKHYSPKASLRLNATSLRDNEKGIGFGEIQLGELTLSKSGDLVEAASNLYNMLRILDRGVAGAIAVAPIPNIGVGLAINDRLRRATA
jgi:L-threonylcarbamoyladenylate synthase